MVAGSRSIPSWVFGESLWFIRGLLHGIVRVSWMFSLGRCLASKAPRPLAEDMALLFCSVGVFIRISLSDSDEVTGGVDLTPGASYREALFDNLSSPLHPLHRFLFSLEDEDEEVVPSFSGSSPASRQDIVKQLIGGHLLLVDESPDRIRLEAASVASDVVWDRIVSLDPVFTEEDERVYDFSVPGSESFVVDGGIVVHNTLNTFHLAGASTANSVTSGVPRIRELMTVSKKIKTPAMVLKLKRDWSSSMERSKEVMSDIQTTRVKDVIRASSLYFDPDESESVIKEDRGLIAFYRKYCSSDAAASSDSNSPWLLRFEFDREKMLEHNVCMLELEYALKSTYANSIICLFSDDNAAKLVCRIRVNNSDNNNEQLDLLTEIKALEQSIVENCVVKGIARVAKAVLDPPATGLKKYDPVMDAFYTNDEWSINTAGSNILDVMGNDFIDFSRVRTNDVYEVLVILGIEAARQVLIEELRNVLGNLPLNHRHLALLADTMVNRGFFMSIDRHGINNRGELGPLAKCSFEQSDNMLVKAGVFSEFDRINGVSANIMVGQIAPCGTGDTQVYIDGECLAAMPSSSVDLPDLRDPPAPLPSFPRQHQGREDEDKEGREADRKIEMPILAVNGNSTATRLQADDIDIV